MIEAMMIKEKDLDDLEKRGRYVVTVVGCGRMGLPTACLFSDAGFHVICLDTDAYIVSQINKGVCPFAEPGLEDLLKKNLGEGRIKAVTDLKEAIPPSHIIIFTLNVPLDKSKKPDYSSLEEPCRNVGLHLKPGTLVIVESTLSPSVTETLVKTVLESSSGLKAGIEFGLAYSPIRARVGRAIKDMMTYSRVVAGIDRQSLIAAKAILKTITKGELIEVDDIKTAEAVKLFENIYRDVNIALANDLAKFCEKAGIDYMKARKAANTQPYCHLLRPGIVSGHIPKDPYLLITEAENLGVKLNLTSTARRVNEDVLRRACDLVKDALLSCQKPFKRSRIAVIGVSFRPNVKEARGSLVSDLVGLLIKRGAKVVVFDPYYSFKELKNLGYPAERNLAKTIEGADCLLITVGHKRFKHLNLKKISVMMKKPAAVVDLAQIVNPAKAEKEGFIYRGLGRGVWTR